MQKQMQSITTKKNLLTGKPKFCSIASSRMFCELKDLNFSIVNSKELSKFKANI